MFSSGFIGSRLLRAVLKKARGLDCPWYKNSRSCTVGVLMWRAGRAKGADSPSPYPSDRNICRRNESPLSRRNRLPRSERSHLSRRSSDGCRMRLFLPP